MSYARELTASEIDQLKTYDEELKEYWQNVTSINGQVSKKSYKHNNPRRHIGTINWQMQSMDNLDFKCPNSLKFAALYMSSQYDKYDLKKLPNKFIVK